MPKAATARTASIMASMAAASASTTFFFFSLNFSKMALATCAAHMHARTATARARRECAQPETASLAHCASGTDRAVVGLEVLAQALGQVLDADGRVHDHENVAVAKALRVQGKRETRTPFKGSVNGLLRL